MTDDAVWDVECLLEVALWRIYVRSHETSILMRMLKAAREPRKGIPT